MDEEEELIVNAIIHYTNLIFDDDDDEEEESDLAVTRERGPWVRVEVHYEAYRRISTLTFESHFRMSIPTFELLVQALGNHLKEKNRLLRLRTKLETALMMVLWVLGNPDPFRSIALKFYTSPGVVHFHYVVIIEALCEMAPAYQVAFSKREREEIKTRVERRSGGFPGVIGCIDTTHIYLSSPRENPLSYVNRHHSHSILAQIVSDDQLLIRDLCVGQPGSCHDSRVFRRSPLSLDLLTKPDMMAEDEHLLGDGAYVLTDKLLIPYRNNGHLTRAQRHYNSMLSGERSVVERLNHLAKCKWRRMRGFESHCVQYAVEHVVASCVLHNFTLLEGNEFIIEEAANAVIRNEVHWPEDVDPEDDFLDVLAEADHPLLTEARARGVIKRRVLTHYMMTGELP